MYNYKRFSNKEYDLAHPAGIDIGQKIPDFQVLTLSGEAKSFKYYLDKPVILETGSITCGMFAGQRKAMNDLAANSNDFSFLLLYIREAHPGKIIPAHSNIAEKCELANQLQYEDKIENRTIIVDDIEGNFHLTLGALPNMVFIVDTDGRVMYKEEWNNTKSLKTAINEFRLCKDTIASKWAMLPMPNIPVEYKIFKRAGWDAARDFVAALPKLIYSHLKAGFCDKYPRFC